jgi:hypothetical protein
LHDDHFSSSAAAVQPHISSPVVNFCQEPGLAAKQASLRKKLKEKSKKVGIGSWFLAGAHVHHIGFSETGICFFGKPNFNPHHGIVKNVMIHCFR